MKAEEAGGRLFDIVGEHRGGLSRKYACHLAGISASQWTRGREYLRELFGQEPIIRIWVGGEWVYLLVGYGSERDAREYWERNLRTRITQARREYNDAHGIAESKPTPENEYQEELARRRLSDLRYAHSRFVRHDESEAA